LYKTLITQMRAFVPAGFIIVTALIGCGRRTDPIAPPQQDWFADRAKESGIDFVHVNGMSGKLYVPEVLAPGVALFDFDNDGDLDVYLVQGGSLRTRDSGLGIRDSGPGPRDSGLGTRDPGAAARASGGRLFRNDLRVNADGTRTLRFTDVTRESGIVTPGYGMGVAAGDFNNDGWVDLYLTKFDAPNQLFRNNGNGTFNDVSKSSGTDQRSWSVSASFVDVNRDGWLDLYVGNYIRYSLENNTPCFGASGALDYCMPQAYQPLQDRLYVNRGDGTFVDASVPSGIAREYGPALGVATADFNRDGWMDIYVANDGKENQLWINKHDGTFENTALLAGVALPVTGKAEASMGVDAGDFDDDGDEDLIVTELTSEGSNLFVNDGTGVFDDRSTSSGLSAASVSLTGFGTAWFDFDNDGRLDLLSVNGTVQIIESLRQAKDPLPLHQRKQLFHNLGDGRFEEVSGRAGAVFKLSEVGRGAAFGDVDNDGDIDVLIGNNNGPTRLLINQTANGHHWIGLRLVGVGGRDMLGARVELIQGASTRWRRVRSDGSYASANDPRVIVGLGESMSPPDVRVTWPDGKVNTWTHVEVDRYSTLKEQ
jgi:enediyne biosynthesis protein E4